MTGPDVATRCPRCRSASLPIVYGMPSFELFEAADRGEVALGGCMVSEEQPRFGCRGLACGLHF